MQQLDYSSGKLIWRALLALLVAPFVLVLATDEHIISGHVRGIWTGLLYAIGPVGRWTLVGGIIAALGYLSLRLIVILLSDRAALRAGEAGLFVRTLSSHRTLAWSDVMSIDIATKVARGRTFHWVRVRTIEKASEKFWQVQTNLLDADEDQIAGWIEAARRLQTASRVPSAERASPPVATGFGRKRSSLVQR
jgi:hypothetical protein